MADENFQVCDRDLPSEDLDRYLEADALAVDTETMGLLPQRDRLCLVQLCNPAGFVSAVRIERGQIGTLPLDVSCRVARALGLTLSMKLYPAGSPVRDAGPA